MKQFFRMAAGTKDVGRVDIYDEIGFWGTSAASFARQWKDLEASSKRIDLHISSPGGNLFDALTIYNIVQQSTVPVDVYVDGLAASSASLIAMAGRKTLMAENALMMMHNPYTVTVGGKPEHESAMRALEAATEATIVAYAAKSGKSADDMRAILDAETWYGADEAKDEGFVDKVIKAVPMAARFDVATYGYTVPESFRDRIESKKPEQPAQVRGAITMADTNEPVAAKPAFITEIKAACDGCDSDFVIAQMEAGATVVQAQAAWTKVLSERLKEAQDKAAHAEREKTELQAKMASAQQRTGVDPVGSATGATKAHAFESPVEEFQAAVCRHEASGKSRAQAMQSAVKENGDLHKAYLQVYNENRRRSA